MGKKAGENGRNASGNTSFYNKGDDFSQDGNMQYVCALMRMMDREGQFYDPRGKNGAIAGTESLSRMEEMDSVDRKAVWP